MASISHGIGGWPRPFFLSSRLLRPLSPSDSHHLTSAQGWLELGEWQSVNDELEEIMMVSIPDPITACPACWLWLSRQASDWASSVYYSEREPKAVGNGYKFISFPYGLEVLVTGSVVITTVGK
jgi:hypothetical protein